jgi:uncharacterized protein (DUF924 family)
VIEHSRVPAPGSQVPLDAVLFFSRPHASARLWKIRSRDQQGVVCCRHVQEPQHVLEDQRTRRWSSQEHSAAAVPAVAGSRERRRAFRATGRSFASASASRKRAFASASASRKRAHFSFTSIMHLRVASSPSAATNVQKSVDILPSNTLQTFAFVAVRHPTKNSDQENAEGQGNGHRACTSNGVRCSPESRSSRRVPGELRGLQSATSRPAGSQNRKVRGPVLCPVNLHLSGDVRFVSTYLLFVILRNYNTCRFVEFTTCVK